MSRLRGLKALVQDALVHASQAIEKVQKETANRPFAVLSHIPPLAEPARAVQVIHDASVAAVHGTIRTITKVVGVALDVTLDVVDAAREHTSPPSSADKSRPE